MELEAAHIVLVDQAAHLVGTHLAAHRIDAGKGDQRVGMARRVLGHLLVADAHLASLALGVDREDHGQHPALSVIGGRLVDRRARSGCLK